jgi:hypothetical protein
MNTQPLTHKFVAVLNKKVEIGSVLNALGHMAAGLSVSYPNQAELRFDTYVDKDGGEHKSVSDNPFIILRADNSNQLRTLRQRLLEEGIHFNDFTSAMTIGTWMEQHERMKSTPEVELEYYGVCMFGETDKLAELTKKFSLWR